MTLWKFGISDTARKRSTRLASGAKYYTHTHTRQCRNLNLGAQFRRETAEQKREKERDIICAVGAYWELLASGGGLSICDYI